VLPCRRGSACAPAHQATGTEGSEYYEYASAEHCSALFLFRLALGSQRIKFQPLYRDSIGVFQSAGLIVGPTMVSADRETAFSAGNSAFPIGGRDCWRNIPLRRSADCVVGRKFGLPDRPSALSAGKTAFPIGGGLCSPNIGLFRSAEANVGATFGSADRTTALLARLWGLLFGKQEENGRICLIRKPQVGIATKTHKATQRTGVTRTSIRGRFSRC
jgi:hypothetical protein